MKFTSLKSLLFLVFAGLAAIATIAATKNDNASENSLKAGYIYLEASAAISEERYDDYYMLLRRASSLNPSDPYIAGALAEIELVNPQADSASIEEAYNSLRRRFESSPTDDRDAGMYASLASQLGRFDDAISAWETVDSLNPDRTDPAMNLADVLIAKYQRQADTSSFNRAIEIYSRLQKSLPGNIPLAARKINALMSRRDSNSIYLELERLVSEAPGEVQAALFTGSLYSELGKEKEALVQFDRACELDSTSGAVYLSRANFFRNLGDSAAYDREVFRALESPVLEFESKFRLLSDYVVKLYSDSTQRPRITEMFNILQEVNPGEAQLHSFYGAYEMTIDNATGAAEQFRYSVDLEPGDAESWQGLVQAYGQLDDSENLLEASREALSRFPDQPYFALSGSWALMAKDDFDGALALLDSVSPETANTKALSMVYSTKGDIFYKKEETDSAIVNYERAISLDDENFMAMNNVAYYMAEAGRDLDKAMIYASLATMAEPKNMTFLDTKAWVCFKQKDFKEAKTVMDEVLSLIEQEENDGTNAKNQEPSSDVYDHAGDIYFMNGEYEAALDFWKRALELEPENEKIQKKVTQKAYSFE